MFVPRGLSHCFQNVGDERASRLAVYSPGEIEQFFENFAAGDAKGRRGAVPGADTPPPQTG